MPGTAERPPLLTDRFDRALLYATNHHRHDLRKSTAVPYVAHLLAVAAIVLEMGGSEDEAIGGLLHDVVEDGGGLEALAVIRESFGETVAAIVRENSDSTSGTGPKGPWRERKVTYIDGVATKRPEALRVSIADKLHNARSIVADLRVHGDATWNRFSTRSGADQAWYYGALVAAFAARRRDLGTGGEAALAELQRTVAQFATAGAGTAGPHREAARPPLRD